MPASAQNFVQKITLQGGFRRGGLTPALAPRMPTMTEDVRVGKSMPAVYATTVPPRGVH